MCQKMHLYSIHTLGSAQYGFDMQSCMGNTQIALIKILFLKHKISEISSPEYFLNITSPDPLFRTAW